ncbi:MAG: RluA family pseudouridine synthase [Patescibacteria group bacterium]|jgi:23S rRNA pseudouridine1911/1915/1917 synthase
MDKQTFKVPADIGKVRLDLFLTEKLGFARSQVQKLIKDQFVSVDDEHTSVHRWLKAGETIKVTERPARVLPPVPNLEILTETDDYLVVNKRAGILVHPAAGSVAPVLTEALLKHCPSIAHVGQVDRPGIVHRLDRDVSGVLVVAKTQAMYDLLTHQFRERLVKKVYTTLVHGNIEREEGDITFVIARSKTFRGRMAARPANSVGREAKTSFLVLKRFVNYTLLEVAIHTGRSHQIRTHLKAFGHPVVGDPLYGARQDREQGIELPRLFLQASTLGFTDLADTWCEYNVALDPELSAFLETLS